MAESRTTRNPGNQVRTDGLDYILTALVMGLMGAFFWAIRGTGGYGGSSGGALAGLGWAMLWLGFSRLWGDGAQRPYGSGRMVAAITFGIAFGGMTGYGVYIGWIGGNYYLDYPNDVIPIAPWTGYAMLFFCGIHWGGVTGAFMAWCAPKSPLSWRGWGLRIASGVGGAVLANYVVHWFPQFFLPFYDEGYYQVEANKTSIRALHSLPNVMQHVGLFAGFLAFEVARRDWRAVRIMGVMALGFAIPFAVGGYWHTMYGSELRIDWWKNWEMTIGMGGGLAFGLAFYLFNQADDAAVPHTPTRLERIFGIGLPLWLAGSMVVLGAIKGFMKVRGHGETLDAIQGTATLVVAVTALLLYVAWIVRTMTLEQESLDDADSTPMSMRVLVGVVAVIIVSGYATSIPPEIKLANGFLLTAYSLYLGISALLFGILWSRRPE